ncbi:MAG: hypothetical protein ABIP75_01830 [Pyrinomonadaceae bacterium]
MTSRVAVVLYILLCLVVGAVLSLLPWIPQGYYGFGDWGNNYFLLAIVRKTGFYSLQHFVGSGWVRGAVTGLGMLNLFAAFWEIAHFNQAVKVADSENQPRPRPVSTPVSAPILTPIATNEPIAVDLSDNQRVDEKQ